MVSSLIGLDWDVFSNPPSDWAVVSLFWEGSSSDAIACPGWAKNATVAINAEKYLY